MRYPLDIDPEIARRLVPELTACLLIGEGIASAASRVGVGKSVTQALFGYAYGTDWGTPNAMATAVGRCLQACRGIAAHADAYRQLALFD